MTGWTFQKDNYLCEVYAFADRRPCAVAVSRLNLPDGGLKTVSGPEWVRIDGVNVEDDGKLTIHWKNGGAHRQTVIESGPLYEILRSPESTSETSSSGGLGRLDSPLLDAFFAEHAK